MQTRLFVGKIQFPNHRRGMWHPISTSSPMAGKVFLSHTSNQVAMNWRLETRGALVFTVLITIIPCIYIYIIIYKYNNMYIFMINMIYVISLIIMGIVYHHQWFGKHDMDLFTKTFRDFWFWEAQAGLKINPADLLGKWFFPTCPPTSSSDNWGQSLTIMDCGTIQEKVSRELVAIQTVIPLIVFYNKL